eukprot:1161909-Pelagomonas_calceolata.AAC.24
MLRLAHTTAWKYAVAPCVSIFLHLNKNQVHRLERVRTRTENKGRQKGVPSKTASHFSKQHN